MPLFALNHCPSTPQEWRERIAKLQGEAAEAERELEAAREKRKQADLESVLNFKPPKELAKCEEAESRAERKLSSLRAAVELATLQLQKTEAAEGAAEQEKLRQIRARAEIVQRAERVDQSFTAAVGRTGRDPRAADPV